MGNNETICCRMGQREIGKDAVWFTLKAYFVLMPRVARIGVNANAKPRARGEKLNPEPAGFFPLGGSVGGSMQANKNFASSQEPDWTIKASQTKSKSLV